MSSTVPFENRADPGRPPYFTGEGILVRILPDEILGRDPYLVQARTHRKKRTNKKGASMSHYLSNKAIEKIQEHTPPRSVEDLVEALKSKIFYLHSNGHMDAIAHQELNTLATDFLLFADAVSDDGR